MNSKLKKQLSDVADEWIKCSYDPEYFIENYCKLKDQLNGQPLEFRLWLCQKDQLKIWCENRFSITLKSRQIGISWESAAYALWKLLFNRYYIAMVVSKKESAAIGYLDKVKFFYNNLPDLFKQMCPLFSKPTKQRIEFLDIESGNVGSTMTAESANPEAGRCETLNLLIMDEAAFMPDATRIWTAAEPTLEQTNGQAIIISTANGYDDFFQPKFEAGELKLTEFRSNFISWQGDPKRTQAWFDRKMSTAVAENKVKEFKQEFPSNAVEAFIVSGNTFFDTELIEEHLRRKIKIPRTGKLDYMINELGQNVIYLNKNANGLLKVWDLPSPDEVYVGGVDSAEGVQYGDYSVACIYNHKTGEQVAELSGRMDVDTFAKALYMLGEFYNFAKLNIEANNVGISVFNYLVKQRHYPNIYRQLRYDEHTRKREKKLGWKTTANSKRVMLDALAIGLREKSILPHSRTLFSEMKHFMQNQSDRGTYSYNASKGHDDTVIAHSLASICLQETCKGESHRRNVVPQPPRRRYGGIRGKRLSKQDVFKY